MERLTERDSNGTNFLVCREGCNGGPACFECEQKAIDRLAAYEDTGVMPEKVTQIKLALEGKLLAEIKEFDGIPADRVIELLQAEKDGRLVVLPPNDPLTLEELREMDEELVWVEKNGATLGCALIYSPCSIVYITISAGTKWDAEDLLDEGCKFYRRKPEEEEKNADRFG